MNFITFPVGSTNIFPAANGTNGSQLLSEWNLRSRETVDTSSQITYEVGHSYVHSKDDFYVRLLQDDSGEYINSYTLEITEGRGVINGHFIESLTSVSIDLVEANAKLKSQSKNPLKGSLTVGLRAYYATEETVAGTLLVENDEMMYLGIQVVILPSEEFITPSQSPYDSSKVTAHLKLATFNFSNNKITAIQNSTDKLQYISAERLTDIDMLVSSSYVRKTGLNPKKIYAFAGKGTDPSTGLDTWEDVTDCTMIWDANPQRTTHKPPYSQAQFIAQDEKVYLCAPHKNVEGMTDGDGVGEYFVPRLIEMPVADFGSDTPGTVSKAYTQQIKNIADEVHQFKTTLNGKQIYYMASKDGSTELPVINPTWNIGDYILVNMDYSAENDSDGIRPPSTMYVILPGKVLTVEYKKKVENDDTIPSDLTGVQLIKFDWSESNRDPEPETEDPEYYPEFFTEGDNVRGVPEKDYFRIRYVYSDKTFANFYYVVKTAEPRAWSDYVMVTGQIPLAEEESIGGFLNVSKDNTDYGYVYRDDTGRLRLVDYALLRSGVLAYQLGEDIKLPSGIAASETQTYINEYVNQRVAFPNENQIAGDSPSCIHIYISLYEEEEPATITITGIDSRFNTAVCLHILGTATSTTTVNIYDCEKLRIDNGIEGNPVINVYRSNLYYDPYVFNYIRGCARSKYTESTFTGLEDIRIWYEMFESTDANLLVDGMTVSELGGPVTPTEIDYWKETNSYANDNHYLAALKSITFSPNGDIVKVGLLVSNQSTDNVDPGEKIVMSDFELPQGSGLVYPKSCLTSQLKVDGTFVSAYLSGDKWYVTDTSFTALTESYDEYDLTPEAKGTIAFHSKTSVIESTVSQTSIPAWETDTYHIFYGGAI